MKSILIFSIVLTMVGCASRKMANESQADVAGVTAKYQGKIVKSEGCGYVIQTTIDGEEVSLYAVNLSDEFKKANMKVQFDFIDSRAMLPENCKATKVVVAENMSKLK
jgi:uncharacterized protein (DUF39 family)